MMDGEREVWGLPRTTWYSRIAAGEEMASRVRPRREIVVFELYGFHGSPLTAGTFRKQA